jgi:hypothetical protein
MAELKVGNLSRMPNELECGRNVTVNVKREAVDALGLDAVSM